jgi:hypothetical protein
MRKWLGAGVVFRTRDVRGEHSWLIDPTAQRVTALDRVPAGCVVIETPALVLNDCTRNRMFSVWGPSKRLRVHLPTPQHLGVAMNAFTLLDLFELEMLPLAKNFSLRSLAVRLRRWREVVEFASLALKHKVLRRKFNVAGLYALPAPATK